MTRRVGVVVLVLMAAATAGCGGAKPQHPLTGTVTVYAEDGTDVHFTTDSASLYGSPVDHAPKGTPCVTEGGFSDIAEGADVVVKDETGKIVANGNLGGGVLAKAEVVPENEPPQCSFTFSLLAVPKASIYTIGVANRGDVTFSYPDLQTDGWQVALSIGTPS